MLSAAFWSRELRRGKKRWDAQEMSRRDRDALELGRI
jgi:hypothetical protein